MHALSFLWMAREKFKNSSYMRMRSLCCAENANIRGGEIFDKSIIELFSAEYVINSGQFGSIRVVNTFKFQRIYLSIVEGVDI